MGSNFQGRVETLSAFDEINIDPGNLINVALIKEMTQLSNAKTAR